MSLYSTIRQIAGEEENEQREQIIAFGIALALAINFTNKTTDYSNPQAAYLNIGFQEAHQVISEVSNHLLLDVRYALELTRQLHMVLIGVKSSAIVLNPLAPEGSDLFGALFNVNGRLNESDLILFRNNSKTIIAIAHAIEQSSKVE